MAGNVRVTLTGGDGSDYVCQILDIFEFKGSEYAMLLKEEDEMLVVMRYVTRETGSVFQTIESEEEFEQVLDYIRERGRGGDEVD